MLNFTSKVRPVLQVNQFPKFTGHRVLLMPFIWEQGSKSIPANLIGDYADILDSICQQAPNEKGVGYLTIDEAFILSGKTHRRPGLHVDGVGKIVMHTHSAGGGGGISWGHGAGGGASWGHSSGGGIPGPSGSRSLTIEELEKLMEIPKAKPTKVTRVHRKNSIEPDDFSDIEVDTKARHGGFFIASSIQGCKAFDQEFEGFPIEDGDCAHLASQCGKPVLLDPNLFYWMNAFGVHDSIPMQHDCYRQLIRVSTPNDAPWQEDYTHNPLVKATGPIIPARPEFTSYKSY